MKSFWTNLPILPVAQRPTRSRSQIQISHLLDTPFPNKASPVQSSTICSPLFIPFSPQPCWLPSPYPPFLYICSEHVLIFSVPL
ncbi:hypothetical protein M378DRAFT_424484 [Amanita muscaria Koide BX008]|uniref:Uncharacterized protein n=1 Tax=Amanita muscaria (strain Koide BX008) TaxID=946122 RepID=A0A0C2WW50_AMAMK|nr:hypothetical protein M378DRAFT_424484 [Amanita muscaria Koide BX008]